MQKFGIMVLFVGISVVCIAKADGLPANPWQNRTNLQIEDEAEVKASSQQPKENVADIWGKVRNTQDFRHWSVEKQSDDKNQNLLTMLENLNRVGYLLPDDYQNIVKNMPSAPKATASQKTQYSDSYKEFIRKWRVKYHRTKSNSLNILENSYYRTLSTIKQTTGVDVNRAVNNSISALK